VTASIARVLIDSPLPQLDRLFDYGIPEALVGTITPGMRVRVPLRSAGRVTDAYVIEVTQPESAGYSGKLSEIESIVSLVSVLSPEVWALARRVSERASGNASDIVRLAVPNRQVRVEKAFLATRDNDDSPASVPIPESVPESISVPISVPIPASTSVPPAINGFGDGVVEEAIAAGARLAINAIPQVAAVSGSTGDLWVGQWAITMAQSAAYAVSLGKTAILAVPDYRDQEQLISALGGVLPPEKIVRLDARQSNPDRYRAFLRCLSEHDLVIVGNRSVVYAPATNLGLIALWDDGDPLHSEPLSPYVHTRDAALVRQEQQGCALLFFSHTRSTDVERLVEIGWCRSISPVPAVLPRIIPTSQQPANDGFAAYARIPETAWREARAALEHGPVLVQVARPGYAPRLSCKECRRSARCLACEGPLAQKTSTSAPACSWCGALAASWRCNTCDGDVLRLVGSGAGRTAEDLGRAFPGVRIIIADGDRPVLAVGAEPAIVIATRGAEPVAAGGYRAVLLLDGESMIARESLRVAEDCLRWWSNAAALAARRAPVILVGVGGALASTLATWRHPEYARSELADRRELRFPPAVRVATLTGELDAVTHAVTTIAILPADILGPIEIDGGTVRTIVRFEYSLGAEIAAGLKAEIVRAAARRRRPLAGKGPRGTAPPSLRVRFDDIEPFLEN
jgi:primosomal protein N' (replication factor Y)